MVRSIHAIAILTLWATGTLTTVTPAIALDNARCLQAWKELDSDENGLLETNEDKDGTISKVAQSTPKVAKEGTVTRDEYLSFCLNKAVNESGVQKSEDGTLTQNGSAFPADRGKGELTRGTSKLSEDDVKKRLEAHGFRSIEELKLGDDGIWRGTAESSPGTRSAVAVDPQGDIVAN